jgi:hypothetical protein
MRERNRKPIDNKFLFDFYHWFHINNVSEFNINSIAFYESGL